MDGNALKFMLMSLVDQGLKPTIEDLIRALDWAELAGKPDLIDIEFHMERDARRRASDKTGA